MVVRAHLPEGVQQSEDELVLALHVLGEALRGAAGQHVRLQLLHVLRQRRRRRLRSTITRAARSKLLFTNHSSGQCSNAKHKPLLYG